MSTGYRFRAYPDDHVARVLARWIGCQRFIKNAKVREDRYYRAFQRRFAAFAGQHAPVDQAYAHLVGDGNAGFLGDGVRHEADTTWLRDVPSQVLRNGAARFYQAYQRFFKGLARRPTVTSRHGEQSAWLTSELFEFVPAKHDVDGVVTAWRLLIGTKKFPCGELPFKDHIAGHKPGWTPPASIHVSVNAGRWHVSFSNEAGHGVVTPTEQETLDLLRSFTAAELAAKTVGLDRGVAVPLMATVAAGAAPPRAFELLDIQKRRLAKKEQQRKRWQRRAARRVKGSKNRRKAHQRAASAGLYAADVRTDFAHQTSRALVDSPNLLFVFEALQVKNMTRSAAGAVDAPGKKVAQKRGLNRSILASAWGETKQFTKYKALAAGKLCIEVPPHHSSQECSACGHTHADNRLDQSRFVCLRCGHAENADTNAARVIARRGVEAVVSGSYTLREKKKVGSLRRQPSTNPQAVNGEIQLGPERSEVTSVETVVSRRGPRSSVLASSKQKFPGASQETPTTALRA
ncbi:RNA-guided endonuclease InsQ/TnpB family protein [Paucibacter soli]|uniref:RNA-guided endonuclease InsQ/TnpB family protein n=1 Tax=Paucibacter soli TaxID=3133433 RepID=UPI003098DB7F